MSKTILLTKGDIEVVIGRLEKEDIQKYEQNDFRDEAIDWILQIK